MSQKPVTSIDVAKRAGVSQPTVSRAFDPDASIAPATRAKVLAAAKALGYQPNVIARSLKSQRTNIVGLVMANLTASHFYPHVLDMFTAELQAQGKQSLLFSIEPDRPVDDILQHVLGYQVDALVIASTTPSHHLIDECAQRGTPVILFNRLAPETSANSVCCDNVAGGRLAADLLLDKGHERLGFISGIAATATNTMRQQGFIGRLQERGIDNVLEAEGAFTYESGFVAAQQLLNLPEPPDAIFCAADIMALGAIDAARELGFAVPADVSIVGFDDIPAAAWPAYHLTTIQQPVAAMVKTAVSLITAPAPPIAQQHLLPGKLIQRSSVR